MNRFNMIELVKSLIRDYTDEMGTSYFIPSMSQEFNPRCDDSLFQAMFLEYNPSLYNHNEEFIDTINEAGGDLVETVVHRFEDYLGNNYNYNPMYNGITIVTSDKAGTALTIADSDLGLYITYMETMC